MGWTKISRKEKMITSRNCFAEQQVPELKRVVVEQVQARIRRLPVLEAAMLELTQGPTMSNERSASGSMHTAKNRKVIMTTQESKVNMANRGEGESEKSDSAAVSRCEPVAPTTKY